MSEERRGRAGERQSLLGNHRTPNREDEDTTSDLDVDAYETFPVLQPEISAADDSGADIESEPHPLHPIRAILLIVSLMLLLFVQAANISMLTTTQGVIATDLNAFESTTWFTSAYLVATASIGPLSGKLAYVFAPRWCIFVSAVITSLGVTITGFSSNLRVFLIGRAVTGVGAAGILTVAVILLVQLTSVKRRGLFLGLLNSMYTVGVAAGAVVAGALEPVVGWRALFWMQGPLALLAGIGLLVAIPSTLSAAATTTSDQQQHGEKRSLIQRLTSIDYLGALLLIASTVSLLYGLSTPKIAWEPIVAFIALFPAFLFVEIHWASDPIIPISVLSSRATLLSCLATVGFMMSRWSVLFYSPVFMTAIRGAAPAKSGSILIATNAGFALGGILPGLLHIRRGGSYWGSCLVIFAVFPVTLVALALTATQHAPLWYYIASVFVNGLCAGAAMNYTLAHVLHLVPAEIRFIVTSLIATFRGFAGTFGSAIGGGVFVRVLQISLRQGFEDRDIPITPRLVELIRQLSGSPRAVRELSGAELEVAIWSYEQALRALFLSGVGLACLAWVVQAGTGWTSPGEKRSRRNKQRIQEERG